MVTSCFNSMPGIPVMHSMDLVNWKIAGHVYDNLPLEKYDKPFHDQASWAPSIRYHNGKIIYHDISKQKAMLTLNGSGLNN